MHPFVRDMLLAGAETLGRAAEKAADSVLEDAEKAARRVGGALGDARKRMTRPRSRGDVPRGPRFPRDPE